MRKVFIDLGCFDGDTVRQFYGWANLIDDPKEFYIYGFDPTPRYKKNWKSMESENSRLKFYQKAVSTYDGKVDYCLRPENEPYGSSTTKSKLDYGMGDIIEVDCIDFSDWIKQFKNDYVIVKMDIEGAEYEVLEKMIQDGTDEIMDTLLVEWHGRKRKDDNPSRQDNITKNLRCEVKAWL